MLPKKKLKYEKAAGKKESKFFSIFLCLSMLIVTSLALGVSYFSLQNEIPALYRSVLSRSWSKTDGKITKTFNITKSIRTGSAKNPGLAKVYVPKVNYSFQVGNEVLTGDRMNFSGEEKYFSLEEESTRYLTTIYQVNQNVEVFYNPANPQESSLSQEYVYDSSSYQAGCCCGSLGILFGLLFWLSEDSCGLAGL